MIGLLLAALSLPAPSEGGRSVEALKRCAPATMEAAVSCLQRHLPGEVSTRDTVKKDAGGMVQEISVSHFGLELWIRNNWGLNSGGPLFWDMQSRGIVTQDDMSTAIIDAYNDRQDDQ